MTGKRPVTLKNGTVLKYSTTEKKFFPQNAKALNDGEAIYCRNNIRMFTHKELADRFEVSENCVKRCVQGQTYKHLDKIAPPWQYHQKKNIQKR